MPGKLLYTLDTLSCALVSSVYERDKAFQAETDMFAAAAVENLPASPQCLDSYKIAQSEDPICSQIMQYCLQGWPSKHQIAPGLKPYWMAREASWLSICL